MPYPKEMARRCKIHRRLWDCIDPCTGTEETEKACPWCRAEKAEAEVKRLTGKSKSCKWQQDSDGNWETECHEMFILNDGGPNDNRMNYCPYCGCVIEEE